MEQRISEKNNELRKNILIIIGIILLILIVFLFLIFHKKTYEITFDSNGGSEVASVKVKDGDLIQQPDDPTKEGYTFAGWYYLNELYDFNTRVRVDMTLKAEWVEQGNAEVEGISLDVTELTLVPNGTASLNATLLPENAKQVKLIWSSGDENIATVDENGNIKALTEGTVTVTVSTEDGNYTANCTITVTKDAVAVEGISINGEREVTVGNSIKLTATITPDNATNKSVTWSSSNSYVAKVDKNGNVTGLKAGKVTITAKSVDGGYEASYTITVKIGTISNNNTPDNSSTSSNLGTSNNPSTPSNPSQPSTPNNPPTPSNPNNPSSPSNPSNPSEPDRPNEPSGQTTVNPTSISISGPTSVEEGSSIKLSATVNPTNATNKSVTWSVKNGTGKATINQNGSVTGVSAGTVTITATTSNGISTTYTVTVTAKPQPPKEDTYSITFTRIRQEGTNNVMQYTFVVYKNGSVFTAYKGFNCGGTKVRPGNAYVSLNSEATSASITLSDGTTVVTATVDYKG